MPDNPGSKSAEAVRSQAETTTLAAPDADDHASSRAARKAQTRSEITRVARQLFAEHGFDGITIADIAAAASVSAQTVYNHFATKEELFFDGRTQWVDGPAAAVRAREPGTPPLTALRDHLIEAVWDTVYLAAGPDGDAHAAAIEASPALRIHQITLLDHAERRLTQALADAWASDPDHGRDAPGSPAHTPSAPLISATWLAATRVVVATYRPLRGDPARIASEAAALIDQILCRLETV